MLASLLPTPLHPAVVHLPIALAILAPLITATAWIAVRRGARRLPTWGVAVTALALTLGSGLLAKETGEDEEEQVERVVAERVLEPHEEAADRFIAVAGGVLAIAALGLLGGSTGAVARGVATAGTVALVWVGYSVGHSGGQVAYQGGAAAVYAAPTGGAPGQPEVRRHEDDADR